MTDTEVWISVAIAALVTALIRFLPFIIFSDKEKIPRIVRRLSSSLPYAIMGMLVVYCLKDISFTEGTSSFLPAIISSLAVILLHAWKKNTLLSIIAGTVSYMLMVQQIF